MHTPALFRPRGLLGRLSLILLALSLASTALRAQWTNAHPGGGGQIQGVNPDPNTPGRLYLGSDVEGNYRSDDYGLSWKWIGKELTHHMAFNVVVEPGNANRIYAGTAYGLHVSNNAGENWTYVTSHAQVAGDASVTATIVIDPDDVDVIYTAPSWHVKDDGIQNIEGQTEQPTQQRYGTRRIFKSTDRGVTWSALTYEQTNGYRHVYTLTLAPNNSQHVYLGAYAGLYRSTNGGSSFTKLPAPSGFANATCRGADLSPDGNYIYAVFGEEQNNGGTVVNRVLLKPYVARVGVWDWTEVSTGLYFPAASINEYWKPVVDPRSGSSTYGLANTHKVLLGCMRSSADTSQGLFEGTFTVAGNGTVTGSWDYAFKRPVGTNLTQEGWDFEFGWNNVNPQVRQYTYTPISWNQRKVWLASQQSLYVGDSAHNNPSGYRTSFGVRSTALEATIGTTKFYRSRGFASTVNFDMDGYANYLAQTMADNCILESWDDGVSWSQAYSPLGVGSGDSVLVLRPAGNFSNRPPYVLLGAAVGPGGGQPTNAGTLWVKEVVLDPTTSGFNAFSALAGGSGGTRGLNTNAGQGPRIYAMAAHPANPGLLFLGTLTGLYVTDNVYAMIEQGTGSFTRIDIPPNNVQGWRIYPDPLDQDVVYFAYTANGSRAIKKGVRSGGSWTITTLASFTNNLRDFAFWRNGNQRWLAYSVNDAGSPSSNVIFASDDDGASWDPVLTHGDILATHSEPWWEVNGTQMEFDVLGLVGDGNTLYTSTHVEFGKHGYAILRGELTSGGTIGSTWTDWTGTWPITGYMDVPRLWRARGITWNGQGYYMAASRGGGLWYRPFGSTDTTAPAAPTGLSASAGNAQVALDWNNNTEPDLAGYTVLRSTSSGGPFNQINPGLATSSDYTDTGLVNGTTYYFRVTAVDTSANESVPSSTVSATPSGGSSGSATFISLGTDDGYLTESSESSNVGGSAAAGGTGSAALRVGDTASNQQVKSVVSFDTSGLPDTATITGATLRLQRGSQQGTDPFTTHGQLRADAVSGAFGGASSLASSDFEATASAANVTQLSAVTANGQWSEGTLNSAGLSTINKSGLTQFRLYFQTDDDNDSVRDDVGFWPGEATDPAVRPELVVQYSSGTPTATLTASDASAGEPSNNGQFTVTLSPAPSANVTVNLTSSGSATFGADYTTLPSSVVVGTSGSATIAVNVLDDALYEGSETVVLTLAMGAGYTIGSPAQATVTITDNETVPTVSIAATDASAAEPSNDGAFTVTATPAPEYGITVNLGVSGTSTAGADYTTLPASISIGSSGTATVSVDVLDDSITESNETVILSVQSGTGYNVGTPSQATVTIADNDAQPVTVTFFSIGSEDGYVTESTETSNAGGSAAVGGTGATAIRAGDDASDRQFKSILSFDTSSLPDGATVTAVTVRLLRGTVSGTNPFDTHGQARVDVNSGGFNGSTTLEAADFEASATATNAGQLSNAATNGTWSEASLNAAGFAALNKTGTTQLRVYFTLDDNDDGGLDYIGWLPGEAASGDQPELIITYTP